MQKQSIIDRNLY